MRAVLIFFSIVYLFVFPVVKSTTCPFMAQCDGCWSIRTCTIWPVTETNECPTDTPYCDPDLAECVRDPPPSCASTNSTSSHGTDTRPPKPGTSKSFVRKPHSPDTPEPITPELDMPNTHTSAANNLEPNNTLPYTPGTATAGTDSSQNWYTSDTTEPNTSGLLNGAPSVTELETPWIWPTQTTSKPSTPAPETPWIWPTQTTSKPSTPAPETPWIWPTQTTLKPSTPAPETPWILPTQTTSKPSTPAPETPWIWPTQTTSKPSTPAPETPWIWPTQTTSKPNTPEPSKPEPVIRNAPDTPDPDSPLF